MTREAGRRFPRRRLIKAAVAGALLLGAGAAAVVRTRGYAVPAGRSLVWMSPWQFVVFQHAARRIAAPDRAPSPLAGGADASIPSADDMDVAGFADGWIARMPAAVRRDLGRFLAYLEHVAPVGSGCASRFTRLPPADQDRVLAGVEASSNDQLRAGFEGLKSLVFMGYYRDARTWRVIGYDGPIQGRPEGGWR
jgi:hypothetical protein